MSAFTGGQSSILLIRIIKSSRKVLIRKGYVVAEQGMT